MVDPQNWQIKYWPVFFIDGLGDFFKKPGSPPLNFHEDITMLLFRLPGKSRKHDRIMEAFGVYLFNHVRVKGVDVIDFVLGGFHRVVASPGYGEPEFADR